MANGQNLKAGGKYSELPARIASAIVLAALAVYSTWMGGATFSLLFLVASFLILWEYRNITASALPFVTSMFAFGFFALFMAGWFSNEIQSALFVLGLGGLALAVWEFVKQKSVWGAAGLFYAALPFVAMVLLRDGPHGITMIIFLFACVWGADTFAYFTGKTLGGPKLWPAVSPKKTWSGFIGGLVGACLLTSVVLWWFGHAFGLKSIMITLILGVFAQAGDLVESSIKRRFNVKDSGKIIPGHGGVLDRIDGLIFSAVAALIIGFALNGFNLFDLDASSKLLEFMSNG